MQERASQTRRLILEAAAQTFETHGYQGTRLQDVVAGRAVSKGALYFHFASKEELAAAVINEQHDLLAELAVMLRPRHSRTVPLLIEMSRRIGDLLRDDSMTRASTRLACERDQIGPAAPVLFDAWIDTVERLLEEAKAQGDVLPEADSRMVAELIIAALAGMQRRTRTGETSLDLHTFVMGMWRMILPGLAVPERRAEILDHLDAVDKVS
ncbi:ScbR family autoregulator-binding transcription factor [Actinomadura kijaniata]|uniref:ScbR family autoregulator-binding transcription factor n=1 Tax=Actinomadura kijaniata TaxID=46161 RepID=UPI00082B423C|nr:ScbR family autoregulator-binding transcription factor [Actinomadura kijaniata]